MVRKEKVKMMGIDKEHFYQYIIKHVTLYVLIWIKHLTIVTFIVHIVFVMSYGCDSGSFSGEILGQFL